MSARSSIACVACAALLVLPAAAHHVVLAEDVAFEQHLDARLPLQLPLVDDTGRAITLGGELAAKPAVLVLGYLGCRDLCPLTLSGVREALRATRLDAGRDYRALFVSIDPRERTALAREKAARIPQGERGAWAFLGGDASAVEKLARAVGMRYRYDAEHDAFAHPAGFVVLTAQGTVSRYFFGVRFDAREVETAVRDAAGGKTGSLATRLAMLCYHFDPATGRYTLAILDILRAVVGAFVLGIAFLAWRNWRKTS